jgi:hypothetical protein
MGYLCLSVRLGWCVGSIWEVFDGYWNECVSTVDVCCLMYRGTSLGGEVVCDGQKRWVCEEKCVIRSRVLCDG